MNETGLSARANRQGLSQQQVTCCPKFRETIKTICIYTYTYLLVTIKAFQLAIATFAKPINFCKREKIRNIKFLIRAIVIEGSLQNRRFRFAKSTFVFLSCCIECLIDVDRTWHVIRT